jgi:hypothetical protein
MGTTLDVIDFGNDGTQKLFTTQDPFVIETLCKGFEAEIEARDAWLPAHLLLGRKDSPLYNRRRSILRRNPSIRRRHPVNPSTGKPRKDRQEIHVGDWYAFLTQHNPPLSDLMTWPAPAVDVLLKEVDRLRAATKARKKDG